MSTPKTVSVELTMKVKNAANVEEARRVLLLGSTEAQATQLFPQNILPNLANVQLALGGVTQAKWALIEVDQEVTLKLNQIADTGFPMKGIALIQSYSGITSIYVSTGPNATCVNLLAIGS